jgi:hypothetical protein
MGIMRRPDTGQHFIQAPKARSSRQRYEKTPLVRPRTSLFAALAELFRRQPRPFVASAIADRIDQGLKIDRQARRGAPVKSGSRLYESVSDQLRQHVVTAYTRADNALDGIDDSLKQEAAWLDEAKPNEILSTLETKLEDRRVRLHTELLPMANDVVRARINLEEFKHRHHIPDDFHWGKRLDMAVFGQVGVLLLIEFVANAVFQSDTQQTGLIGGVLVASLTSLATIILGMLFGLGFQRANKVAQGGIWVGIGLIALAFLLSFIFVSSLSLVRIAGEAGVRNPLAEARTALMNDPFAGVRAMLDLPAFAYTLCICGLITAVARKYLQYGGAFPGGKKRMLDFLDAQGEFENTYQGELDEAKDIASEHTEMLEAAPNFIVNCKVPIQTLVADHENVLDQHKNDIDDITGAARLFTAYVRETNQPAAEEGAELPATAVTELVHENLHRMAERHVTFAKRAAELCDCDDVSQASIVAARERLNDVVEAKLGEYALERESMLEQALTNIRRDKAWLADVLAVSSTTAASMPQPKKEKASG